MGNHPGRKLLWVGDAGVGTGFAGVTHNVLDRIHQNWDVGVLGINYRGDPHPYDYQIWRADRDGDPMGFARCIDLVQRGKPDVLFIHQDPWWVIGYMFTLFEAVPKEERPKIVAYMPVDTKGEIRPSQAEFLSQLDFALFYTKFAQDEAVRAGLRTNSGYLYLGTDTKFFQPIDKRKARERIGLTGWVGDRFLIGNVNRNQTRKRIDLTVRAFKEWLDKYQHDAYLYLHMNRMEVGGWNLHTLAQYYGILDRVVYPTKIDGWDGGDAELMSSVYSSFDVQVSTTLGEGWGLTQLEGLACGIPQIAPDWSALGEWLHTGSILVPCSDTQVLPGIESNGVGGVVDTHEMGEAIEALYTNPTLRSRLGAAGQEYAHHPQFDWNNIAAAVQQIMLNVTGQELAAA